MKRKTNLFPFWVLCAVLLIFGRPAASQVSYATAGTEFMFCVPDYYQHYYTNNEDMYLLVSSHYTTQFTVSVAGLNYQRTYSIQKNSVLEIELPNMGVAVNMEVAHDTTFHIQSDHPISVTLRRYPQVTGAGMMTILPVISTGKEYHISGYHNDSNRTGMPTIVGITAFCDNTPIEITTTDTSHTGQFIPNKTVTIMLNAGESYQFRNMVFLDSNYHVGDLAGTFIQALGNPDQKIAVTVHSFDYAGPCCADNMYEMMVPDRYADTLFLDFPDTRHTIYSYRVLATENSTNIWVNQKPGALINPGEFYQFNDSVAVKIRADKPVHVYRIVKGSLPDTFHLSDPELVRLEPINNLITRAVILPQERPFYGRWRNVNVIQVFTRKGDHKGVILDGLNQQHQFQPFPPDPDWYIARIKVDTFEHWIQSDKPFFGFYHFSTVHGTLVQQLGGGSHYDFLFVKDSLPSQDTVIACRFPHTYGAKLQADEYLWSNGQTQRNAQLPKAGTYWVRQRLYGACDTLEHTDTLEVVYDSLWYEAQMGPSVCPHDSTWVNLSGNYKKLLWQDSSDWVSRFIIPDSSYHYRMLIGNCWFEDSVFSESLPAPELFALDPVEVCDSGKLNLALGVSDTNHQFQWKPEQHFIYGNTDTPTVLIKEPFTAYLVTTNHLGCERVDSLPIGLATPDSSYSLNSEGWLACEQASIQLSIYHDDLASAEWHLGSTILEGEEVFMEGPPNTTWQGEVYVRYGDFCRDTIPFLIELDSMIIAEAVNAFTPNGDGLNDRFHPLKDPALHRCSDFQIYSRWGNLVFESTEQQRYWEGMVHGKPATDGTYFYIVKYADAEYKGSLTLVR
ncbi:gliding motility-associated C-terminal domain-containing protein [bacterium SCSIO 12741]|nr:gliding motility-associated C-terminal domain-containing protein [bacterium SCSIO 12741]